MQTTLTVATYNIHQWVGGDRCYDPVRTAAVIRELNAGIIGLQEVVLPRYTDGRQGFEPLTSSTGLQVLFGPTLVRKDAPYGNAVLSAYPVRAIRRIDISVDRREPRGLIDVDIDVEGIVFRIINTHLGLKRRERIAQISRIEELVKYEDGNPTILMGDFNEWLHMRSSLNRLFRGFGRRPRLRTFPAVSPLFMLDCIGVRPGRTLADIRVHRSRLARLASDHLPVRAEISLNVPGAPT